MTPMTTIWGPKGQRTGDGTSTTPGPTTGGAGASAEGAGSSTTPDMHEAPKSPSNPEEEFQISQDKGRHCRGHQRALCPGGRQQRLPEMW